MTKPMKAKLTQPKRQDVRIAQQQIQRTISSINSEMLVVHTSNQGNKYSSNYVSQCRTSAFRLMDLLINNNNIRTFLTTQLLSLRSNCDIALQSYKSSTGMYMRWVILKNIIVQELSRLSLDGQDGLNIPRPRKANPYNNTWQKWGGPPNKRTKTKGCKSIW